MSEPHTFIIHHGYLTEQDSAALLFAALSTPHQDRIGSFFTFSLLQKKRLEVGRWDSSFSYFPKINKYFKAHFVLKIIQEMYNKTCQFKKKYI